MKKQESPSIQSEKTPIILTKEQSRTNGGETWDDFFRDSREDILRVLKGNYTAADGKFAGMDTALEDALEAPIKGLKKDKQGLITKDELFLRGLEYYRGEHNGFGKAKGLEEKYAELRKQASEEAAKKVFEQLTEEDGFDFGDPGARIEDEVDKLIAESVAEPDVDTFRSILWEKCMEKIS